MTSRGKEPARFTTAPAGITHAARNYGMKGMEISNMKYGSGALQTRVGCTDTYVWREREAARLSHPKSYANNAHFGKANRPFDDEYWYDEDWYDEDDWVDEDEDEDEDEDDSEFEVGVDKVKDGVYKVPPLPRPPYIVGGQGKGVTFVEHETSTRKTSDQPKPVDDDSWIVKGDMPGGPSDGSVIPSFGGHVARRIWEGKPRGVLKCYNLTNACEALVGWKKSLSPNLKAQIDATGLGHLPSCMFKHIDMPLISAFVERWQPDTNSFHLPFGEMTIMLHDVWQILRIPVDGCLITSQSSSKDLFYDMSELLRSTPDELVAPPTPHWSDDGVSIESILALCRDATSVDYDTKFSSWMFLMLGASLFVDKNESRIRPSSILEVNYGCDFGRIPKYAWGAATLAYLYRQLGVASRGACDGIAGCLTLLQAWIYEYFPCFRPHQKRPTCGPTDLRSLMWSTKMEDKNEARLCSIRTRLDYLTPLEVNWLPYGPNPAATVPRTLFLGWLRYQDIIEPYMPERVLRQLGYKQVIPSSISRPEKAYRPEDSKLYDVEFPVMATESAWQIFPRGSKLILSEFQRNSNPSACSRDYLAWFLHVSHPCLVDEDCSTNRTNAAYWMSHMLTVIQPWMDARDIMPTKETRDVAGAVDDLIRRWNISK